MDWKALISFAPPSHTRQTCTHNQPYSSLWQSNERKELLFWTYKSLGHGTWGRSSILILRHSLQRIHSLSNKRITCAVPPPLNLTSIVTCLLLALNICILSESILSPPPPSSSTLHPQTKESPLPLQINVREKKKHITTSKQPSD